MCPTPSALPAIGVLRAARLWPPRLNSPTYLRRCAQSAPAGLCRTIIRLQAENITRLRKR